MEAFDYLILGKRKYTFPKELSVGLLEDLLKKTKNTDLFMYLEVRVLRDNVKPTTVHGWWRRWRKHH